MASANIGSIVAEAWDWSLSLAAYGHKPLTVGWHRGEAFVHLWNWRNGRDEWRRLPSRDVPVGQEPKPPRPFNPFASDYLFRSLM